MSTGITGPIEGDDLSDYHELLAIARDGFSVTPSKATRMSCWNLVTILSKLGCFTYLGDVSNLLIKEL